MHKNSFLFDQDPAWKPNCPGIKSQISTPLQSWIYEKGSLTKRLKKSYGDSFQVEILFHRWKPPYPSECNLLALPHYRYNLIREVLLHANGKPLILARTILPKKTIQVAKRNLSHLGNRPLGEVIFSYPNLQRHELNICSLSERAWSTALLNKVETPSTTWGRRTVYAIQNQKMIVSEFFLSGSIEVWNQ